MKPFGIELRATRGWLWCAVILVGWLAIDFLSASRWLGSWRSSAVWCVVPITYLAPLVSAGAADVRRVRVTCGLESVINVPSRRGRVAHSGTLFMDVLILGVFPVLGASVVMAAAEVFSNPSGTYTATYLFVGLLFTAAMVALGHAVANLFPSRIAAPLVAVSVGLVMALYGSRIPPTNFPWTVPNPMSVYLTAILCGLLIAAAEIARPSQWTGRATMARLFLAGTCVVLSVLVAFAVMAPQPKHIPRTSTADGVCERTDNGSRVCVWPDDRSLLSSLVAQTGKLEAIAQPVAGKRTWLVSEPGLPGTDDSGIYPPGGTTVEVTPIDDGDGLWLTAESMAYGLLNLQPSSCDVSTRSPEQQSAYYDTTWALIDVMSDYIYGGPKPNAVVNTGVTTGQKRIVEKVSAMSKADQLDWIATTFRQQKECS